MAEFQAMLQVSNERSLARLTARIVREFPLDLGEPKSETYWKDEGLRDVKFPVLLGEGEQPAAAMCRLLAAAWTMGDPWTVLSVGEPYTAGWSFEAIADYRRASRIRIPGVEWMRISLLVDPAPRF